MTPLEEQRTQENDDEFNAWNPGISSQIPTRLMPRSTMFDASLPETSLEAAIEHADYCGLKPHEVALFSTTRLIQHELLIRVTADLTVPDGPEYEELGINLRGMTATIYERFVLSKLPSLKESHRALNEKARAFMQDTLIKLRQTAPTPKKEKRPIFWLRIFKRSEKKSSTDSKTDQRDDHAIADIIRTKAQSISSGFERDCFRSLSQAVDAVLNRLGYLPTDSTALLNIALIFFSNRHGSEFLGRKLQPIIEKAAETMNYRFLPAQERPVVMNVKGSSASGKSTIRPLQRALAERIGIPWNDFALISPDYWRKYLLDYESLGEDYKYGGMLTGHELEVIDRKLDHYMAEKAASNTMPHLLIDRFRFDSFNTPDQLTEAGRLLSRFGDTIYLFFMITPPHATVERAWSRGQTTGRYKAVDDLLHHNIEAFEGIKKLFFSWVLKGRRKVHFEFLDNDVPKGELPKTVAFGWNDTMKIIDVASLTNIDRFATINVDANAPDEVYKNLDNAKTDTKSFLHQCAKLLHRVDFIDQTNSNLYGRLEDGVWIWRDDEYLQLNPTTNVKLDEVGAFEWEERRSRSKPHLNQHCHTSNHCIGKLENNARSNMPK